MKKKYLLLKTFVLIMAAACMLTATAGYAAFRPGERALKVWGQDLNPSKQAIFLKF